jgi:predicted P-loop ATPase
LPTINSEYQLAIDYEQSFINFSSFKEEIKVQLNNVQKWEHQINNSTKNFVLADEDDEEYRYLELKKESDNVFELTIQHPLSPLQAMAIAMTRFDAQLK